MQRYPWVGKPAMKTGPAWHPRSVLVLGGSSEVARAIVCQLVATGAERVLLAGRSLEGMETAAAEVRAAGAAEVQLLTWDATDTASQRVFFSSTFERFGEIDLLIMAVGVLGSQETDEHDPVRASSVMESNFTGPAAACLVAADQLRAQGRGVLVVLSSVAGVRPRRANFIYGASKAALDHFCQALDDSLHDSPVRVMIVRPGFVRTKMTAGRPGPPMQTTPAAVARQVLRGLERGSLVVWAPPSLRWIFLLVRMLPRSVFRKLPG